jgi:septal ring factor EnvC (AmiA/AmiB activator)
LPNDSNGFLVALAGQERRVLELKEELQKAEDELKRLKKQWAHHEAHKKKAEIRHVEQLQPLQTVVTGGSSDE